MKAQSMRENQNRNGKERKVEKEKELRKLRPRIERKRRKFNKKNVHILQAEAEVVPSSSLVKIRVS